MARQSDQIRRLIPPRLIVTALGAAAFLLAIAAANAAGLIIGNPTTSVPRGLYYAASPARAEYATFCLAHRHRQAVYYPLFCSPDHPDGLRILKRIAARAPDGHLIVRGDSPRALDSRILGAVHKAQIRGWWRALIQIGGGQKEGGASREVPDDFGYL